jgi:magnesium transporter
LHFVPDTLAVWFGELDIFVGPDFLMTVHDGPTRSVQEVLPRVQAAAKLQRPDRVLYALLDNMVDRYLPVLDMMGERIDEIEDQVHQTPTSKTLANIFTLKRGLIEFRRTVGCMREMVNAFLRQRPPYFRADMAVYWRDLYDHVIRALTMIESYRDLLTGVLDVYLTASANRTNEIMKVLTIYATIGLPLVLLTGYFGMNFTHLPLIDRPYGVVVVTCLMVVLPMAMLVYFRRRKWL